MKEYRWERRERKHRKAQYGMQVDGRSTKTVLARVERKPKRK
jgi:hypothetical protein